MQRGARGLRLVIFVFFGFRASSGHGPPVTFPLGNGPICIGHGNRHTVVGCLGCSSTLAKLQMACELRVRVHVILLMARQHA